MNKTIMKKWAPPPPPKKKNSFWVVSSTQIPGLWQFARCMYVEVNMYVMLWPCYKTLYHQHDFDVVIWR